MSIVFKPVYLIPELGDLGRLPDGGIINIGGTNSPTFTVDGKALIFADGTATDGSGPVIVTGGTSSVTGYEHIQLTDSGSWYITHSKGTERIQVTIWDENNEMVIANVVKIHNPNAIEIFFGTPMKGRAILMMF